MLHLRSLVWLLIVPSLAQAEWRGLHSGSPEVELGAPVPLTEDALDREEREFRAKVPKFSRWVDLVGERATPRELNEARRFFGREREVPGIAIPIGDLANYLQAHQWRVYDELARGVMAKAPPRSMKEAGRDPAEEKHKAVFTALTWMATNWEAKPAFLELQRRVFAERQQIADVKLEPPPRRRFLGRLKDRLTPKDDPALIAKSRYTVITGGPSGLGNSLLPPGGLTIGGPTRVTIDGNHYHLNRAGSQLYAEGSSVDMFAQNPEALSRLAALKSQEADKAKARSRPARTFVQRMRRSFIGDAPAAVAKGADGATVRR